GGGRIESRVTGFRANESMEACRIAVDADDVAARIDVPSVGLRPARHHEVREDAVVNGVAPRLATFHVDVEAHDEATTRRCPIVHGGELVDLARAVSRDHDTVHAPHCVMVVAAAEYGAVGEEPLRDLIQMARIVDALER